jgi:hypothetical protein
MKKLLAILSLCLLTACPAPMVSQLDRMKSGSPAANAKEAVTCTDATDACVQLHLLKGDACFTLARDTTSSSPARRQDYACAADELGQGIASPQTFPKSVGSLQDYARKRLEALRGLIDTRRAGDPSGAPELAQAATTFRSQFASDPAGPFYLASAELTQAQDSFLRTGDKTALCAALTPIEALRKQGAANPQDLEPNYRELAASLAAMRRSGACP